jgi:hypothetical protein
MKGMNSSMDKTAKFISKWVHQLITGKVIIAYRTRDFKYWIDIKVSETYRTFYLYEEDLGMELRLL